MKKWIMATLGQLGLKAWRDRNRPTNDEAKAKDLNRRALELISVQGSATAEPLKRLKRELYELWWNGDLNDEVKGQVMVTMTAIDQDLVFRTRPRMMADTPRHLLRHDLDDHDEFRVTTGVRR